MLKQHQKEILRGTAFLIVFSATSAFMKDSSHLRIKFQMRFIQCLPKNPMQPFIGYIEDTGHQLCGLPVNCLDVG